VGDFKDIKFTSVIKKTLPQLGAIQFIGHEINNSNSDFLSEWLIDEDIKRNNCYILVGNNLRYEMPIYNLKLRKKVLKEKINIIICGSNFNTYTYPIFNIGNSLNQLSLLIKGKHRVAKLIIDKEDVVFLFGNSFLQKISSLSLIKELYSIIKCSKKKVIFNSILAKTTSCNFQLENLNLITRQKKNEINLKSIPCISVLNKLAFLYNNESLLLKENNYDFVIYHGHHGSSSFADYDVLLPHSTFFEQKSFFLSLNSFIQENQSIPQILTNIRS